MWWEEKKHVLVREKNRIDNAFPGNNFVFEVRNRVLWLTGTLFGFFEFGLKYPQSYPFHPPDIYPKDRTTNWVPKHQYRGEGRFCLDIREKTWNSTLSAADIINSLGTLLIAEKVRKLRKEEKLLVYEEDEPTKLQRKLKQQKCVVPSDIQFSHGVSLGILKYFYLFKTDTFRIIISGINHDGKYLESPLAEKIWGAESFLRLENGVWLRTSLENVVEILSIQDFSKIEPLLVEKQLLPQGKGFKDYIGDVKFFHLLMFDEKYPKCFFYMKADLEKNTCEPYGTYVMDSEKIFERLPSRGEYETLRRKNVAVIGCGSGGSRVAEYLIKAGVTNLTLIDGDILTVENIIRHACQLDDISIEKVYAVKNKLLKINPNANIRTLNKHLDTISPEVEELLKDSDLIIVATASNEELFNGYSYTRGIPAIYAKVYPLGFGGEIIRIIPGITPCFECCHYQKEVLIEKEFEDAVFPNSGTTGYDTLEDGQQIPIPALAVDADFIALITAKMAIELLTWDDINTIKDSPHIRLWGNKKEWIFNQEYQCLSIENKNINQLGSCLVCYGNEVIEKEIGKNKEQIEEEYKNLVATFKREEQNDVQS
jgi:molybdopterin/thiamine biosynthesis adenylyltransferase/ubiquitin-protein ligase